jgi:hypothetical protein
MLHDNKQRVITDLLCKVSVDQFYGIEYEEFPCQIAQVGLLLMKHQMDKEVSNYFGMNMIDFPIKETATIVHGNALRIDWETVVPKDKLNYIMGNPPFVGYKLQNTEQKIDMRICFPDNKNLDYVAAWYKITSKFIENTSIEAAFVSTNSITQGEQVSALWKQLINQENIQITFAYRTFRWGNDARGQAAVHCVIIGLSKNTIKRKKTIYAGNYQKEAKNINPYLVDAPSDFILKRSSPLCEAPLMIYGSEPREGGFLILSDAEKAELIGKYSWLDIYIRPFVSAEDYINNQPRWCLWLKGADVSLIRQSKEIVERLKAVREFREGSKQAQAHAAANTPGLFASERQPAKDYILIPVVSSESRKYVPIGYVSPDVIASNACFTLQSDSVYDFGIITSLMHMAWMRRVCGRLEMRYRYSNTIVYNNFPWPDPTESQRAEIEHCAQAVLDARDLYPESSLADLYDPNLMPVELTKAHQHLDRAVEKAYGRAFASEEEMVAFLFERYAALVRANQEEIR